MRITSLAAFMVAIFLFGSLDALADWGIKRYKSDEINKIYKLSEFYFDRGDYKHSIKTLESIEDHQHTVVRNHIEAIKVLWHWRPYRIKDLFNELISLGVNKEKLYDGSCKYVLKEHNYSMYIFCAKNKSNFMQSVDNQINSMLRAYYNNKTKPYHEYKYLPALVNKDELTGLHNEDTELIRERIKAILEEKNCDENSSSCDLPSSAIEAVIRNFIYK